MTTSLYRQYNKDGVLLYVGVSESVMTRLSQHSATSKWFRDVTTVTVKHFRTRRAALRAETKAIAEEHPVYNVIKQTTYRKYNITEAMIRYSIPRIKTRMAKMFKVPYHIFCKSVNDWKRSHKGEPEHADFFTSFKQFEASLTKEQQQ